MPYALVKVTQVVYKITLYYIYAIVELYYLQIYGVVVFYTILINISKHNLSNEKPRRNASSLHTI
jgi:hypothetical protein